jgi:hypothetical protein
MRMDMRMEVVMERVVRVEWLMASIRKAHPLCVKRNVPRRI